jgi:hypothetical protein
MLGVFSNGGNTSIGSAFPCGGSAALPPWFCGSGQGKSVLPAGSSFQNGSWPSFSFR